MLVTGLAAAVPIIVSCAEVLAAGWVPLSDDAVIAVRSLDVLSAHPPLLGQYSVASSVVEEPTYSPGPLLYWLLALPARLPGPSFLIVTMGLVNVASVIGVVGLARRRGGPSFMFAVAIAVALMLASLPADTLTDVWNPSAALLPFTLLVFLAWSVGCGEYRLLPLTVLAASFVAQCHLTYVAPALGVLAVGLGGLALRRRSGNAGEPGALRRWWVAGILVALICWSAPVIDELFNSPGNFSLLVETATTDRATVGFDQGWRAVVQAIGVLPWWLGPAQVPLERIADLVSPPNAVAFVSALLMVGGLAAVTLGGRRWSLRIGAALGLVLCGALILVTAATPESSAPTLGYSLRWASPAGMCVWLVLGWSLVTLFHPLRGDVLVRRPAVAIAGLGIVAVVGAIVAVGGEIRQDPYDEMDAVAERLRTKLPPDRPVRVALSSTPEGGFLGWAMQAGVVYSLRRDGHSVTVAGDAATWGQHYKAAGTRWDVVRVHIDVPPPATTEVIARLMVLEHSEPGDPLAPEVPPERAVAVTLTPARIGQASPSERAVRPVPRQPAR